AGSLMGEALPRHAREKARQEPRPPGAEFDDEVELGVEKPQESGPIRRLHTARAGVESRNPPDSGWGRWDSCRGAGSSCPPGIGPVPVGERVITFFRNICVDPLRTAG